MHVPPPPPPLNVMKQTTSVSSGNKEDEENVWSVQALRRRLRMLLRAYYWYLIHI